MTTQVEKKRETKQKVPSIKAEKKKKEETSLIIVSENSLEEKKYIDFENRKSQRKREIKEILDKYAFNEKKTNQDLEKLLEISMFIDITTIKNRLEHGKIILAVQEILKGGEGKEVGYKDGCFTAWLIKVYGNKQTAYNHMRYTNLYNHLEDDVKKIYLKMPFTAAAALEPRGLVEKEGTIEVKPEVIEIIKGSPNKSRDDLMCETREKFPTEKKESKKNRAKKLISLLNRASAIIESGHVNFNSSQWVEFEDAFGKIEKLKEERS